MKLVSYNNLPMRNLEIDYPKVGAGIDFAPILTSVPSNPLLIDTNSIISASGRPLDIQVGQNYLNVRDADRANDRYAMQAFIDRHGLLRFSLFTRIKPKPCGIQAPVHPDFFAGKFVGVAIQHLNRFRDIDAIVSEWGEKSIGYASFMRALEETGDKTEAAKSTWSWQTFSQHGFSVVRDIRIDLDPTSEPFIDATFARPR